MIIKQIETRTNEKNRLKKERTTTSGKRNKETSYMISTDEREIERQIDREREREEKREFKEEKRKRKKEKERERKGKKRKKEKGRVK